MVRITHCMFRLANFFTLPSPYGICSQRFARTARCKSHHTKKFETGGSDPTFWRTIRPKVLWGHSRPARKKSDHVLPAGIRRCSQP